MTIVVNYNKKRITFWNVTGILMREDYTFIMISDRSDAQLETAKVSKIDKK